MTVTRPNAVARPMMRACALLCIQNSAFSAAWACCSCRTTPSSLKRAGRLLGIGRRLRVSQARPVQKCRSTRRLPRVVSERA